MPSVPLYSSPSMRAPGHSSSPCASRHSKPNIRGLLSLARGKFLSELHQLWSTGIPVYRCAGTDNHPECKLVFVCRYAVLRLTGVPVDRHSADMPYCNEKRLGSRKRRPSLISEATARASYRYTGLPVYRYIQAINVDCGKEK